MNFNTQPNRAQQSHSKDFRRREPERPQLTVKEPDIVGILINKIISLFKRGKEQ
jgi:hypothetical protein